MRPGGRKFNLCMAFIVLGTLALFLIDWQTQTISSVSRLKPLLVLRVPFIGNEKEDEEDEYEMNGPPEKEELFIELSEQITDMKVDGTILTINKKTEEFKPQLLNIHIVLHSHVDPGWLETFEEYYTGKVKSILDLCVEWLTKTPRLKFIWSEMSFLERWWRDATDINKTKMKKLISNGQIELSGGAWVMTDEATPHFSATIDNMIEGQRFVWNTFAIRPNTSWSVDPFGHGLMVPSLLSASGIKKMVIGRLNDHQKQQFRETRNMRFHWMQPYTRNNTATLAAPFVNMLPYLYYTTRNACGPEDSICCKYHVGPSANWCSGTIHKVTDIKQHTEVLLNQYRVVQKLYNSDNVLIPVGDDFYLTKNGDWEEIVNLYFAIADYIDKTPSLNAKMHFSTVSDFFQSIKNTEETAPTLTGDFFPYTQNEHQSYKWWTGYFTHRPFFKRMGRILESRLRAFDILSVLTANSVFTNEAIQARRDVALFQHHDAITGTSKKHVMEDYLERLVKAHEIFSDESSSLLSILTTRPQNSVKSLEKTPEYKVCTGPKAPPDCIPTVLPELEVIQVPHGISMTILAFNPLLNTRNHVVRIRVNRVDIRVLHKGTPIKAQINPVYTIEDVVKNQYELVFLAKIAPLSTEEFVIEGKADEINTVVANAKEDTDPEKVSTSLKNNKIEVKIFGGMVDNILIDGSPSEVSFGLSIFGDAGGAYVLETTQQKQSISRSKRIITICGPIEDKLINFFNEPPIQQEMSVIHSDSPHLNKAVDIKVRTKLVDRQALFFDISSKVFNDGHFFTDANGMYMMQRTFNEQKNFDANVFPAASSTFIQDKLHRISVHLGQPNGVIGSKDGLLQILIDRVVSTDDGKGLPFGEDHDMHLPDIRMRFFPESRGLSSQTVSSSHSIQSQQALDSLRNPLSLFIVRQSNGDYADVHPPSPPVVDESLEEPEPPREDMKTILSLFRRWPCQLEIVTLRYISDKMVLMIVRRITFDESIDQSIDNCSTNLDDAWRSISAIGNTVTHANLVGSELFEKATVESFAKSLETPFSLSPLLISIN